MGRRVARRGSRVLDVLSGAANAAPDVLLGCCCLAAIFRPELLSTGFQAKLQRSVAIEFAVVHATGFLFVAWITGWSPLRRTLYVAGLSAFYTLVLGAVGWGLGMLWMVPAFWGLMANRILSVVVGRPPDGERFQHLTICWAGTLAVYMGALCLGLLAGGGMTWAAARWIGACYFLGIAWTELTDWRWVYRWQRVARSR